MKKPSASMIVATLALVIAVCGTAGAASGLIDGANIKPRTITAKQLKAHAVTRGKLASGLAPRGPRGRKGSPGPAGAAGPAGPVGAPGLSGLVTVDNGGGTLAAATCPAGKRAIGGGAHAIGGYGTVALVSSLPTSDGLGWTATAERVSGTLQPGVLIYAICATVVFP